MIALKIDDFINTVRKPKILMVDDREENLVALERLLRDLPLELYKANSGNEALKLTLHHDFALALLDIQMPDMDGYELAEILRHEEKTATMPFIFISAIYTDNINVFRGYEKGAFSYITKPFEPEVLLNKVKFFVEKYQQEELLKITMNNLENLVHERTLELEKANGELIRSNEELERFAYVASHDLQEPLRVISSYLQLLEKKYNDQLDEKAQKYISTTIDASSRMKRLINDLLLFSRVGTRGEEFIDIDLNTLIAEVLRDLEVTINEKQAVIEVDDMPKIKGDPSQIRQLFQNLIGNGIKFGKPDVPSQIKIGSKLAENNLVELSVEDNGIGIEKDYYERVFIIFQRLHTRQKYEGTGIGLAISKKIVERHGGQIWVESEPGEGCVFKFTLSEII